MLAAGVWCLRVSTSTEISSLAGVKQVHMYKVLIRCVYMCMCVYVVVIYTIYTDVYILSMHSRRKGPQRETIILLPLFLHRYYRLA